jgi:hypothetical protein
VLEMPDLSAESQIHDVLVPAACAEQCRTCASMARRAWRTAYTLGSGRRQRFQGGEEGEMGENEVVTHREVDGVSAVAGVDGDSGVPMVRMAGVPERRP